MNEENVITINDNPSKDARWYVVHTYSGHEKKVALTLKDSAMALGMTNKLFKVLIPSQEKIVISEGKKRKVDERLYPGYVMVQMEMDDDSWHVVRATRGVTGFVGPGSKPAPLPESEVKTLMKYMTMEAPRFEAKFAVGDAVRITDGPLADSLGKVDEVNEEQGKVKVLVSIFGREVPTELDFLQVTSL